MKDDCVFCKIVNKEIPVEILKQNNHCILIRDANPIAPEHLLIICVPYVRHFDTVDHLNPEQKEIYLSSMFTMASEYAQEHGLTESGYRLVINTGKDAGQTVKHLHMHLIGGAKLKNDFGA
jgi:histidine triad (HIT) family protein